MLDITIGLFVINFRGSLRVFNTRLSLIQVLECDRADKNVGIVLCRDHWD